MSNKVLAKSSTPGLRTYEPIWQKLKQPPYKVALEVHPALVQRVKKAVSKEKYGDFGFKELNGHADEDHFYLMFDYTITSQTLVITLVNRFGIDMNQEEDA